MSARRKRKRNDEDEDESNAKTLGVLTKAEIKQAEARHVEFTNLGCVTRNHFPLWYQTYIASPMPADAPRRAVSLMLQWLPLEQADPTNGWRTSIRNKPQTESSRTSKKLSAPEMYASWAWQCRRVSASMIRVLPLVCFCLAPYPLCVRSNSTRRNAEIVRWKELLGDVYPTVDMMDDLVQHTMANELHSSAPLPLPVCRLVTRFVICTCSANGQADDYRRCYCEINAREHENNG